MTEIPAEIIEAFEAELNGICLTWDHSFGLMPEDRREGLRRCFRQIADHHIYKLILAAEQRGAERERAKAGMEIKALNEQLEAADDHARKVEALLEPHVTWDDTSDAAIRSR